MWIFVIFGSLLIIGIVLWILSNKFDWGRSEWETCGGVAVVGSSAVILVCAFFWLLLFRVNEKIEVNKYYAIQSTIEEMRESDNDIERATFAISIIEMNQNLANVKYWYETSWKMFHYKEFAELPLLK